MPFKPLMHLSILAALAACDVFGPASSLSHAAAMTGCGPADGPTLVVTLAREAIGTAAPSYPYASVQVWEPPAVSALAGHTWSVGPNADASAWYVSLPGRSQSAAGGSITITSVDSANTIEGAVSLRFPSRMVATHFRAPWIQRSGPLCG